MYLQRIEIRDIKCFGELDVNFCLGEGEAEVRQWTVLLGENGLGKSTLLQSMAVALAGPGAIRELLPVADGWVRKGKQFGEIRATLQWTEGDQQLPKWPKKSPYHAHFIVTGSEIDRLPVVLRDRESALPLTIMEGAVGGTSREREKWSKEMSRLKRTAYTDGRQGWMACGYGPFRRLSGGAQDADKILYSGRRASRFVTLFREDAALTNATEWLIALHNTARENDEDSQRALEVVRKLFKDRFLFQSADLHIDARSAKLVLERGEPIPFAALSDGYRSMLALGLDLLRWILTSFPNSKDPLSERGVVLIDELDAHLHPKWQREIGLWLIERFSNIQFIIATHSPFLAQVSPRGNMLLKQVGRGRVQATSDPRDAADWRVDQVLTELFGLPSARSPSFMAKLNELMKLKERSRAGGLDEAGRKRSEQLSLWLDKVPVPLENAEDRATAEALRRAVIKHSQRLAELE